MSPETITHLEAKDAIVRSSRTFKFIAEKFDLSHKRVLDIGCGYGEYMQRFGPTSVGITTREVEVEYGKLKGRDVRIGNAETLRETLSTMEQFDVFWCNNILEHLLSPHAFLVHLKEFAKKDSLLILGTPIVPAIPLLTNLKRFRGALAVEHINFFNYKTYELTVKCAGWNILDIRSFFFKNLFLDRITHKIAPHLYLIAQNNFAYHYDARKKSEWQENPYYADLLRILG